MHMPTVIRAATAAIIVAISGSAALAQTEQDVKPGKGYKCEQKMPAFALAPGKTVTDAQAAKICGCIWGKLDATTRAYAADMVEGKADPANTAARDNFSNSYGAALEGCANAN